MTPDSSAPGGSAHDIARPRIRWRLAAVVLLLVLSSAWLLLRSYSSAPVRECARLYRTARTAADTAQIDTLIPSGGGQDPHSCGFIRGSSRWN